MLSGIPLFPEQASNFAPEVDNLYFFVTAVTAFVALLVVVLVIIFAVKYRDRTGEKVGAPIHGSVSLELAWTIIPFLVTMVIFAWATVVFFHMVRAPDQALEIYSTGKQWMWRFQHIDGQSEINELHVPVGRPVKVTFTSEDVLHSLYFPAFRVKADAIPGRYSSLWFTATKTGEYHLFCAEYCGTDHSGMIGKVVVMEPNDYQAWLSGGGGLSMAARGEQLFQQLGCVSCHLTDGSGRGPSLAGKYGAQEILANGVAVAIDDTYVRESILTPQMKLVAGYQPLMPTFQGLVNEEGLMSLIEYIKSLPSAGQPAAATQPSAATQPAPPPNPAPAGGGSQ
jgi:cytochrome c oxidase subunit 2